MPPRMPFGACVLCAFTVFGVLAAAPAVRAEPRFDAYEIRVIRPRYFIKTGHLEMAAGVSTIVNQAFIYTFLATGLLTWHFSETMAVEAQAGYAANTDRQDKRILKDDFAIQTIVLLPRWVANGRFVWTPSYGKFNVTASRIVYFDTNVTIGTGLTGIRYTYDYCDGTRPAASSQYPTYVVGLSQSYFLDPHASLRIGIEDQRLLADQADAACTPGTASTTVSHDDLLLFLAWSYYL